MEARNNSGCEQALKAQRAACVCGGCLQQVIKPPNVCRNPSTSGALAEDEAVFRPLAAVTAAPEVRGRSAGWKAVHSALSTVLTTPCTAQVDTAGLALVDSRAVPAASMRFLQGRQAACCRCARPASVARGLLTLCCRADATARKVYANLPLVEMHAPVVGPAHPFQKDGIAAGMKNHRSGYVEVSSPRLHCRSGGMCPALTLTRCILQDYHTHAFHFDSQYNTFHSYGYATAPRGEGVVGDAAAHAEKKGEPHRCLL